jgi:putative ABC transport system permease protein
VRKIIARNHGFDWHDEDAFEDWDTIKNSETVGKIFDAMDVFLGGVGLVTLTLGAIGIINIMLVAVSERTREIGLRKALGATNRSILLQFFLEGAFLTLMSGSIGMAGAGLLMFMMRGVGEVPGSIRRPCRSCRPRWPLERWPPPASSRVFIPLARLPCCSRLTR